MYTTALICATFRLSHNFESLFYFSLFVPSEVAKVCPFLPSVGRSAGRPPAISEGAAVRVRSFRL